MNVYIVYSVGKYRSRDLAVEGVCKTREIADSFILELEQTLNADTHAYHFYVEEHPLKDACK